MRAILSKLVDVDYQTTGWRLNTDSSQRFNIGNVRNRRVLQVQLLGDRQQLERNSAAFAGRSSGRFSKVFNISFSISSGIDATISRGGLGESVACLIAIASGEEP